MSREVRSLVWYEVIAVLAIAFAPLPAALPLALWLVVAGSVSRAIRRRPWAEVAHGGASRVAIGVLAGTIALGVATLLGNQSLTVLYAGQAGEHVLSIVDLAGASEQVGTLVIAVLAIGVIALATELALRGWIVERVLELSPGSPVLPVVVGAIGEALMTPGDPPVRIAAAVFGAGLGWLYVAGGRSVVAPASARVVFQGGAVALEALRLI